jgi:hypothetical protein
MGMKYIAVSKESGKKVLFKTKAAMDAALKKGSHITVNKNAAKPVVKIKGKAVFGNPPAKRSSAISAYDSEKDKVVTFKSKAELDKAIRSGDAEPIYKAKESPEDVSSVMKNGKKEAEFYDTISGWVGASGTDEAKKLVKMRKLLDMGKQKMPKVFKPDVPEGKPVFRGLEKLSPKIQSWIKTTKREDWKPVTDKGLKKVGKYYGEWFTYTGPATKQFTYTPHRPAQSWTTSSKVAFGFGSKNAVLAMPVDKDFYFSSKYTNKFGYGEDEVIRLGTKSSKPKLILNSRILNKLTKK